MPDDGGEPRPVWWAATAAGVAMVLVLALFLYLQVFRDAAG